MDTETLLDKIANALDNFDYYCITEEFNESSKIAKITIELINEEDLPNGTHGLEKDVARAREDFHRLFIEIVEASEIVPMKQNEKLAVMAWLDELRKLSHLDIEVEE